MRKITPLALAISSVLAVGASQAMAQGAGAFEAEISAKRYFIDRSYHMTPKSGNLFGGGVSYFLTDDLSLGLTHGKYSSLREKFIVGGDKIKGNFTTLDATYHFNEVGSLLRPYVTSGFGHQRIDHYSKSSKDKNTTFNMGTGVKAYLTDNFFTRLGVDATYGFNTHQTEWLAGLGLGINLGGSGAAAKPEPVVEQTTFVEEVEPVIESDPIIIPPKFARAKLETHFGVNTARVTSSSLADIAELAEFMTEHTQTTAVLEGHTDATGPQRFNNQLSQQRAEAVRQVLINEYGIAEDRLRAVGYGSERPIADNATAAGRELNRRVEAVVEAQIN